MRTMCAAVLGCVVSQAVDVLVQTTVAGNRERMCKEHVFRDGIFKTPLENIPLSHRISGGSHMVAILTPWCLCVRHCCCRQCCRAAQVLH